MPEARCATLLDDPDDPGVGTPLTPGELRILSLAALGLSNQEIGLRFCLAKKTVEMHLHRAFAKMHARNRTQAVVFAIADGLLDASELAREGRRA